MRNVSLPEHYAYKDGVYDLCWQTLIYESRPNSTFSQTSIGSRVERLMKPIVTIYSRIYLL